MQDIKVIVATADVENCIYDPYDFSCTLRQEVYSLSELLGQAWFAKLLEVHGYYNKDELYNNEIDHLNNFVYKINTNGFDSSYYTEKLSKASPNQQVVSVYQEVVGAERIEAVAKWKKQQDACIAKEAAKLKEAVEKKRLKAIAKAQKLLQKEGVK